MKNSFFVDEDQLTKWVESAVDIKENFGLDKALGYLIGEKFYEVVRIIYSSQKMLKSIDEQRKRADYNPIREFGEGEHKTVTNLNEIYQQEIRQINKAREVLIEFADLIKDSFEPHEIRQYLYSNPRFSSFGHICSEEEHKFFIKKGAIEHTLDDEIEDAMISGEIAKYFGIEGG